jgi:hypothetical protein
MMNLKVKGIDKVSKRLGNIKKNVNKIPKEQNVKLELLLNDSFLNMNSSFSSLQELEKEFRKVYTKEASEELLSGSEGTEFISRHTNFETWEDLVNQARIEYIKEQFSDAIHKV